MIVNVPSYEGINDTALHLYFMAWSSVIGIRPAFDIVFPPETGFSPVINGWKDEWEYYLEVSQPELQSICAMIQQSNELALKARICRVSPYLLLLRTDLKFTKKPNNLDFSELRTLDAVDLPGAVNSLCADTLSEHFITTYNEIRSLRNRITHLGEAGREFTPEELLHLMIQQYHELWHERHWLRDRLEFASRTRKAMLHDGKYTSVHMEIMYEWPMIRALLTGSEYKKLFRIRKNKRLYICHDCFERASTRYADFDIDECKTAFLIGDGTQLECLMCGKCFAIIRKACMHCKGNVLEAVDVENDGRCHTCGKEEKDI